MVPIRVLVPSVRKSLYSFISVSVLAVHVALRLRVAPNADPLITMTMNKTNPILFILAPSFDYGISIFVAPIVERRGSN
jgi:hypothetical protein